MATIEVFEAALLKKQVHIDEIKQNKGRTVSEAIGYVNGKRHIWNSDGKCFNAKSEPVQELDLNLEQ